MSHHVVGNAVAEDEHLPVADDFAGGLVLLLGFGGGSTIGQFGDIVEMVKVAPTISLLIVSIEYV